VVGRGFEFGPSMRSTGLTNRALTYLPTPAGMGGDDWRVKSGLRALENTVCVGRGQEVWERCSPLLTDWSVKNSSGFGVGSEDEGGLDRVRAGFRYWLDTSFAGIRVVEPVEVVEVFDEPRRRGFAYATLAGHPISGTEAFILERRPDDSVWLTIRSLSRPADGGWWYAYPFLVALQRVYRRRYLRALIS
jgi:uncharacterized protein (UPF0548 family)